MSTQVATVVDIEEVMGRGMGSVKFLFDAGGQVWVLKYYKGALTLQRMPSGFTLPVPAGEGGGRPEAAPR